MNKRERNFLKSLKKTELCPLKKITLTPPKESLYYDFNLLSTFSEKITLKINNEDIT